MEELGLRESEQGFGGKPSEMDGGGSECCDSRRERGEPVWNRLEGQSQQGVLVRRNAVGRRKEMVIPRFWL